MKKFILPLLLIISMTSCKKNQEVICDSSKPGALQLKISPVYNGKAVITNPDLSVQVMLSFNNTESKGDNPENYNKVIKGKNGDSSIICDKLNCGLYYIRVRSVDNLSGKVFSGGTSLVTEQNEGMLALVIELAQE